MQEAFNQLVSEIELIDPQTIYKKDKPYNIYKLSFVTTAIKEQEFNSYKLEEKEAQINLKRFETIKPFLQDMFTAIEGDKDSMQLFAFIDDSRLKYAQVCYNGVLKTALFMLYFTHSSLLDQYLADLVLGVDLVKFIQRKTDTFEYSYNILATFGTVYKIEKKS